MISQVAKSPYFKNCTKDARLPKLQTFGFIMVSVAALCVTLESASAQDAARDVVQPEVLSDAVDHGEPSEIWSGPTGPNAVFIHTDTEFFRHMLDFQNRQSQKELKILENSNFWGDHPTLLFGGQARFSFLAAGTNTDDKFSYLGRFPPDFSGNSATDARILQANAGLTAHVTNSINLHSELLFSDVFTFPDHKQGSLQVRQAYAVFGDLKCCPWYAYIGKKNVSFGDMGTLSPFSQSVVWHYFGALHEAIGVGYSKNGFNITLEGINGGRGIRAADSEERGKLNNFAVNAIYEKCVSDGVLLQLGAGFLLGTIYDATEAEHLDPTAFGEYNSAWDVFAQAQFGAVTLSGEFVSTVDDWPTTAHPV
jgi:hypothetical protein